MENKKKTYFPGLKRATNKEKKRLIKELIISPVYKPKGRKYKRILE